MRAKNETNGSNGQGVLIKDLGLESTGKVTSRKLRGVLEDQGFACALSGLPLRPTIASCDHKLPASRGGTNVMENVMILHRVVNAAKWTMTPEEFVGMCYQVLANVEGEFDFTECADAFREFAMTIDEN